MNVDVFSYWDTLEKGVVFLDCIRISERKLSLVLFEKVLKGDLSSLSALFEIDFKSFSGFSRSF